MKKTDLLSDRDMEAVSGGVADKNETLAASVALAHIRQQNPGLVPQQLKLHREQGRYEVKFISEGMEYRYVIDPANGAVLSYEVRRAT